MTSECPKNRENEKARNAVIHFFRNAVTRFWITAFLVISFFLFLGYLGVFLRPVFDIFWKMMPLTFLDNRKPGVYPSKFSGRGRKRFSLIYRINAVSLGNPECGNSFWASGYRLEKNVDLSHSVASSLHVPPMSWCFTKIIKKFFYSVHTQVRNIIGYCIRNARV